MVLNEVGRVSLVQDGVVLFIVDRGTYQYAYQVFLDLPISFKEDGLRVRFNGIQYPYPPVERLLGVPLRWTDIRKD
jgi:hypothetical protein